MSLETDSYTRRRAPLHLHPSSHRAVSVLIPSHPFCVGLPFLHWAQALLFPFIVYYEWYVTRRHARSRKRRARRCQRGFFSSSRAKLPPASFQHSPFAVRIEKSKIQVENVEDQLIDIISRYWTCVFLVPFWIPYLLLRILLSCIFCIAFDKLLYF